MVCRDSAVGPDGMTNETKVDIINVTVSANRLVLLFANKPLLYAVSGGALAVTGAGAGIGLRTRALRLRGVKKG